MSTRQVVFLIKSDISKWVWPQVITTLVTALSSFIDMATRGMATSKLLSLFKFLMSSVSDHKMIPTHTVCENVSLSGMEVPLWYQ